MSAQVPKLPVLISSLENASLTQNKTILLFLPLPSFPSPTASEGMKKLKRARTGIWVLLLIQASLKVLSLFTITCFQKFAQAIIYNTVVRGRSYILLKGLWVFRFSVFHIYSSLVIHMK